MEFSPPASGPQAAQGFHCVQAMQEPGEGTPAGIQGTRSVCFGYRGKAGSLGLPEGRWQSNSGDGAPRGSEGEVKDSWLRSQLSIWAAGRGLTCGQKPQGETVQLKEAPRQPGLWRQPARRGLPASDRRGPWALMPLTFHICSMGTWQPSSQHDCKMCLSAPLGAKPSPERPQPPSYF